MIINNRLIKIPQVLSANEWMINKNNNLPTQTYTYKSSILQVHLIEFKVYGKFKKFCCYFNRLNSNCWASICAAHLFILISNIRLWLMIFILLNLYACVLIYLCVCLILSLCFCGAPCNNLNNNFHINWFFIDKQCFRIKNNFVIMLFIYIHAMFVYKL